MFDGFRHGFVKLVQSLTVELNSPRDMQDDNQVRSESRRRVKSDDDEYDTTLDVKALETWSNKAMNTFHRYNNDVED
jgi:hypothetical protein